jgi:hypothetical protein
MFQSLKAEITEPYSRGYTNTYSSGRIVTDSGDVKNTDKKIKSVDKNDWEPSEPQNA